MCTQGDLAQRVRARLQHLNVMCAPTSFKLIGSQVSPTSVLSSQLSLLTAVKFKYTPLRGFAEVSLACWMLTHEILAVLSALPAWATKIDLSRCDWPLDDQAYAQLAQRIPTSCAVWVLGSVPSARLQRICHGANAHRAGLGLPRLELVVSEYKGHAEQKVGEHVLIRGPSR